MRFDYGAEVEAYATYLNASMGQPFDDPDDQAHFNQDLIKAKAAMERAWLEAKPTQGEHVTRIPGMLGRLAPQPVAVNDLTHYLTSPLPTPPATVTAPQLVWPMADNDKYGDCTIAAAIHTDQAIAKLTNEPWTYPGDYEVAERYLQMTGGQDTGLVETVVLKAWMAKGGMFGHRLAAFAPLAVKHTTAIKQAVALCGAVYSGVVIPFVAQEQFANHQPWALTHTSADDDIDGGHAVPLVGYNAVGPVVVTWGALQQVTWAWWLHFAEEAYAVITSEVKARGSLRGVNFTALEADLAALRAE
jgi:hypothetical protein